MDLGGPKQRLLLYRRVYLITRTPAFVWVGLDCICWTISTNWDQCAGYGGASVCHNIRSMFRILGIYNFGARMKIIRCVNAPKETNITIIAYLRLRKKLIAEQGVTQNKSANLRAPSIKSNVKQVSRGLALSIP